MRPGGWTNHRDLPVPAPHLWDGNHAGSCPTLDLMDFAGLNLSCHAYSSLTAWNVGFNSTVLKELLHSPSPPSKRKMVTVILFQ